MAYNRPNAIKIKPQKTSKSPDDHDIHGQLLGWVLSSKTIKNNQNPKSPKSQEVAF